jgi:hypothetical protein
LLFQLRIMRFHEYMILFVGPIVSGTFSFKALIPW